MVQAILFDMDGVLVNSLKTHFYAFNATFTKFGAEKVSMKTFLNRYWGIYIEKDAEMIFPRLSPPLLQEILNEYPVQIAKFVDYVQIYPDTKRVLIEFQKKTLKLGLVSSSQKKIVETTITHVGLSSYFDVVVCGDQVKKPKPAPDAILKACRTLGISPTDAVYVGDGPQDVAAGKSAGCFMVGITTTCGRERLEGTDIIIESLSQLLDLEILQRKEP